MKATSRDKKAIPLSADTIIYKNNSSKPNLNNEFRNTYLEKLKKDLAHRKWKE